MPEELENKPATKRDLADMSVELTREIHAVEKNLGGRIDTLDGRVDTLDGRMDQLDGRMERFERRFNSFDDRVSTDLKEIKDTLKGPGGLVARVTKVEERVGLR